MLIPLLAAYLLFASVTVQILAMLLYFLTGRSVEMRFATVVTILLVATMLAFAPLLFLSQEKKAKTAFQQKARTYVEVHAETVNIISEPVHSESH